MRCISILRQGRDCVCKRTVGAKGSAVARVALVGGLDVGGVVDSAG